MKAVLSLGANLGDREHSLQYAVAALNELCKTRVTAVSSFYETQAVETEGEQPDYINCVVVVETELSPSALLGACLGIEAAAGRVRVGFKAPRVLDIDVLLYENVTMDTGELTLPHPRMMYRAFVLEPLYELFPEGMVLGVDFGSARQAAAVEQRAVKLGRA